MTGPPSLGLVDDPALDRILSAQMGRLDGLTNELQALASRTRGVEAQGRHAIQSIGLVRFNPFEDTGSNQSFAVALLDADDNGVILSSLHSRQSTRVYLKAIAGGRCEAALSSEEEQALQEARRVRGVRVTSPLSGYIAPGGCATPTLLHGLPAPGPRPPRPTFLTTVVPRRRRRRSRWRRSGRSCAGSTGSSAGRSRTGTGRCSWSPGPGTGKTEVITRRVAWLIATKRARPSEILALTFTDAAAAEMQARVDVLVPYGRADAAIHTFHAFGDRLLREFGLELGRNAEPRVISRAEAVVLLREHLFELGLERYRPLADPTRFLDALVELIGRAKDEQITPEEYLAFADELEAGSARLRWRGARMPRSGDRREALVEEAAGHERWPARSPGMRRCSRSGT